MTDLRALLTRAGEVLEPFAKTAKQNEHFGAELTPKEENLIALHAEITAALADVLDDGWRPFPAPNDVKIEVRGIGGIEPLELTHWRPLPPPPAERKE